MLPAYNTGHPKYVELGKLSCDQYNIVYNPKIVTHTQAAAMAELHFVPCHSCDTAPH